MRDGVTMLPLHYIQGFGSPKWQGSKSGLVFTSIFGWKSEIESGLQILSFVDMAGSVKVRSKFLSDYFF